jgi:TolB-like protein/Flp pilus assembly protein TadD
MKLLHELKRRNVFRVGTAYVVVAWLVIQVVETIFPAFGFGIHAVRVVTIGFVIGLIPALVFAWVFELTPEGLKKERDVDRSSSITARTGKALDRFIMVSLALALAYFAFDKFVLSGAREASIAEAARQQGRSESLVESYGDQSIAVLPFVNMSDDPGNEYFSDGISEELLNLLAAIPELRVISRSSAFAFKGEKIDIPEVARKLNVAHILEGSVRKSGNQVRITAQLIDGRSDTHLWSETFDRDLDNIFAIQDEIAETVVSRLKVELLGEAPRIRETDLEAYSLFLKARYLRRQNSTDSLAESEQLLRQTLEIDPTYVPAMDDLITVYINQAHTGDKPYAEGYELARALTLEGQQIEPDSGRMYAQMAWIKTFYDNDLQAAADMFTRALAQLPTDVALMGDTSTFLMTLGRLDEAIAMGKYAVARDPIHPVAQVNLGFMLTNAGRLDEAITTYQSALQLSPEYNGGQFHLAIALMLNGAPEAALGVLTEEPVECYRWLGFALAHHSLGNPAESDRNLSNMLDQQAENLSLYIAQVHAFRDEADRAFEWIDKAVASGHPDLAEIHINILFKNLYDDPRWHALLERLGKAPEQLSTIDFTAPLPH